MAVAKSPPVLVIIKKGQMLCTIPRSTAFSRYVIPVLGCPDSRHFTFVKMTEMYLLLTLI